ISTADNSSARVGGIRAAIKVIRVIQDFFMIYNKEADKIKALATRDPSRELVKLLRERFKDDTQTSRDAAVDKRSDSKIEYSKDEVNRMIDSCLRSWMVGEAKAIASALGSMLHLMVEQDMMKCLQEFCEYTMLKIMDETFEKSER
ncbi:MAG: hypothetical protein QG670_602, partial [Thermoproteota archaeon]|nr:hypothetical protein [Thermoproteota archaeon]